MKKVSLVLAALLIGLMALTASVEASPIIEGSTFFTATDSYSNTWSADLYWAVWEPDTVASPLGSIDDYTYGYYIDNHDASALSLSQLTIGNPYALEITDDGSMETYDTHTGDVDASSITSGLFGAIFDFTDPLISAGETSYVLYFTSPYEPGWVSAGLQAVGVNDFHDVPGPVIPEPASMMLLGLGLLGLGGARLKRKV